MTSATMTEKRSRAVQPDEGESYWQPVPANGFVELALAQAVNSNGPGFDVGIQEVALESSVREHVHVHHEEVIIVLEGDGTATIDGEAHPMPRAPSCIWHPAAGTNLLTRAIFRCGSALSVHPVD